MSLQFYLGASGSGKSHRLYSELIERSIKEPDRNFMLIVPDQFTMQTQMELIREHPDHAIMNIDSLSFGRLTHRILEEAGAENVPVIDDTGKSLILRRIASKTADRLPVLGRNISRIGYVHEIKSAISEFMLYGHGTDDIDRIKDIEGISPSLREKMTELSVLYSEFKKELGSDYITKEEKMTLLADNIGRSDIIRGSVIAFDGFTGFTPLQYNVIRELLKRADEVKVSLLFDTDDDMMGQDSEQYLFHMSTDTMRRLRKVSDEAGTAVLPDVMISGQGRFRDNSEMAHLEKNLFRYPHSVYEKKPENIRIFESSTVHEEIRQTCVTIRSMIRSSNLRYSDFAVVSGDLSGYANEIMTVFADFGLPIYMDQARAILLNPFIEMIRSALGIISDDFSQESVMHYLRCGMSAVTDDDADIFENHIRRCGIRGRKRYSSDFQNGRGRNELPQGLIDRINNIRAVLMDELSPLCKEKDAPAGDHIRGLYDFLIKNDAGSKVMAMSVQFADKGDAPRAKEYSQIYKLTIDLLDQFDDLLGDEKMNLDEFTQILEAGFAEVRAGTIPQDVDRIMVGDMERTRLSGVRNLFFIGVNDGNIPADTLSGGILSDIDREKLSDAGVELAPTPRQQMFIQRLYLYMNMTKPSDKLFISYALSDSEGRMLHPSYLIGMMLELYPRLSVECPEKSEPEERLECMQDVTGFLSADLRESAAGAGAGTADRAAVLYSEMVSQKGVIKEKAENLLNTAFYEYESSPLGIKAAEKLYGNEIKGSVSRLELFASCPYAHFLRYGMDLSERKEYEFEAVDLGTVYHSILESFGRELIREGTTWGAVNSERGDEIADRLTEQAAVVYGEDILHSSTRNAELIMRMKRVIRRTVRTISSQTRCGLFTPESYELRFENRQKLQVPGRGQVNMAMSGRIDRIDTYRKDGDLYYRIIDYKSGANTLSLNDIYDGTKLQLPVYMDEAMNIEHERYKGDNIVPAGMFYYHIADPVLKSDQLMSDDSEEIEKMKSLKLSGMLRSDGGIDVMMDNGLSEGGSASIVIPVKYNKNGSAAASSSVYSKDEMNLVTEYAQYRSSELGCGIASGDISVSPEKKGRRSSCEYCAYRTICMIDTRLPGYAARVQHTAKDEEVLEKMKEDISAK